MNKKVIILLTAIICFLGQFVYPFFRIEHSTELRFFTNGLLYLILPFLLLRFKYCNLKIIFYFFVIPSLLIEILAIYLAIEDDFYLACPITTISVISLLFVYISHLFKSKKIILFGLFFVIISTYGYMNWVNGQTYNHSSDYIDENLEVFDENNNLIKLEKLNKVVVLDIWASYCGVCIRDFPKFEQLYQKFKNNKNVAFCSLLLPTKKEKNFDKIKDIVQRYSFRKLYCKNYDSYKKLEIEKVPVYMVIGRDGKIHYKGKLNTKPYLIYNNIEITIKKIINGK